MECICRQRAKADDAQEALGERHNIPRSTYNSMETYVVPEVLNVEKTINKDRQKERRHQYGSNEHAKKRTAEMVPTVVDTRIVNRLMSGRVGLQPFQLEVAVEVNARKEQ